MLLWGRRPESSEFSSVIFLQPVHMRELLILVGRRYKKKVEEEGNCSNFSSWSINLWHSHALLAHSDLLDSMGTSLVFDIY